MWTCASCGGRNPAGTRFCGHCGVPAAQRELSLGTSSETEVAAAVPAARRGEERRLVTVLFADIAGFTTLADGLEPDELAEIIDPVLHTMGAIVAGYGGTVGKYAGDAVLAFFGAPVAHEDDALRALRAAVDMRREVARLARSFPTGAQQLRLHIGVNTGHVVTGFLGDDTSLDYSVLGDAVNTAQRLESATPGGEIYVGDLTRELARDVLAFELVGPLTLKGKAEPVQAWRVASDALTARDPVRPAPTPIVGRARETALLQAELEQAVSGAARIVAIVGEPGVGKTRLLDEVRAQAFASDVRWVQLRCPSHGGGAYEPYLELLRTLTQTEDDDEFDVIATQGATGTPAAYLRHLLGLDTGAAESPPFGNPELLRLRVNEAMVAFVGELASEGPIVVAIEDVQWIDPASAELTALIGLRLAGSPLCLVLTTRPEGRTTVEDLGAHLVDLTRLGPEAVGDLVTEIVGAPSDALLEFVVGRTAGNPLFVQEVVRSLLDANALAHAASGWEIADPGGAARVPTTIESVLAARIDMLPRDAAEVLQVASVIGRRVPLALLAALTTGSSLATHVELLVERQFLDPVDGEGEPSIVFHHDLVVDVAYGRLVRRQRRELHRQLFEVATRMYGEGDEVIDLLAYHAQRAELAVGAVPYLARAGRKAARLFANAQAAGYFREAVAIAEAHPTAEPGLGELLVELATVEELTGDYPEALDHFERACSLGTGVRAFVGRSAVLRKLGRYDECLRTLDDAAVAHPELSRRERVLLAVSRARVLGPTGSYGLANQVLTEALPDAVEVGGAIEAELLIDLCRNEQALEKHESAVAHAARAVALFEELDDRAQLAMALRVQGGAVSDADENPTEREKAIPILERAARLAREVGAAEEEAAARLNLGWTLMGLDRTDESIEMLRRAIAGFEGLGIKAGIANGYLNLAGALVEAGRFTEARDAASASLRVSEEIGHRTWMAGSLTELGEIFLREGSFEQAIEHIERGREIFAELGDAQHLTASGRMLAEAREGLESAKAAG